MKRLYLLFVACLFCLCLVAHADKVDDYVQEQMQKQHIPGLSLAVVRRRQDHQGEGLWTCQCGTPCACHA